MKRLTSLVFWLLSAFALAQPALAQVVMSGTHVLVSGAHPVFTSAGGGGGSGPVFVHSDLGAWFNAASGTITTTLPTSGHSGIVVINEFYNSGAGSITSVTDNQTGSPNTYTLIKHVAGSLPFVEADIYWCQSLVINTGTLTITIATSNASNNYLPRFVEMSGVVSGVDQSSTLSTSSSTSPITITQGSVNTNAKDLVLAFLALGFTGATNPGLVAPATGYTAINTDNGFTPFVQSELAYKNVTGLETDSAAWAWSIDAGTDTAAVIVSFH